MVCIIMEIFLNISRYQRKILKRHLSQYILEKRFHLVGVLVEK